MNIKSLLCISLSLLCCTEVSALTIHSGKILDRKEWSTENTTGYFHASHRDILSQKLNSTLVSESPKPDKISMVNIADSITGRLGALIPVHATHSIGITNTSNINRQYRYIFTLCLNDDDNIFKCVYSQQQINLAPGGDFDNQLDSNLQYIAKSVGHKTFWATVEVEGLSGTDLGHVESYTLGDIFIS